MQSLVIGCSKFLGLVGFLGLLGLMGSLGLIVLSPISPASHNYPISGLQSFPFFDTRRF